MKVTSADRVQTITSLCERVVDKAGEAVTSKAALSVDTLAITTKVRVDFTLVDLCTQTHTHRSQIFSFTAMLSWQFFFTEPHCTSMWSNDLAVSKLTPHTRSCV